MHAFNKGDEVYLMISHVRAPCSSKSMLLNFAFLEEEVGITNA